MLDGIYNSLYTVILFFIQLTFYFLLNGLLYILSQM